METVNVKGACIEGCVVDQSIIASSWLKTDWQDVICPERGLAHCELESGTFFTITLIAAIFLIIASRLETAV